MKNIKRLSIAASFFVIIASFIGCQFKELLTEKEPDNIVEDYNKLFEMNLYSDKQIYKTTDKISIWATLKFTGNDSEIKIWHGYPKISFYISDGKKFNIGGIVNTILTSTILQKDKLYKFDYVKNGGYSNDDENAAFWEKFYKEKDLLLPEGEYIIKVSGGFSVSEKEHNNNLSPKELTIKVEK